MTNAGSTGSFEFRFGSPGSGRSARRPGGTPMRLLVMGDFSGRGAREKVETGAATGGPAKGMLATRAVHVVDIDELEPLMARLGVAALDPLADPADALPIGFRTLEDFHPDRLLGRVEAFRPLRSIRERLRDPARFDGAARELVGVLGFDPAVAAAPATPAAGPASGGLFASLLAGEQATTSVPLPGAVEALVRSLVAPHVVKGPDGRQGAYLAATDAALSAMMQRFMHAPHVRELERLWRGVHRLITSVETGERLSVHLLDVSRDELVADLAGAARAGGVVHAGLYKQLVEATVAGEREDGCGGWGAVALCETFGRTLGDAVVLSGLAQVAMMAGTPFLAGGHGSLVGCESFADGADPDTWAPAHDAAALGAGRAWEMLRSTEEAAYVALGMPRVLLRTPYGAGGEPAESFAFEELPPVARGANASADRGRHEAYLWGHPGLALAEALGNAFLEDGWSMDPGTAMEIGGLPVHSFVEGPREGDGGPRRVKACAEAWMTERGAQVLREAGVTALQSIKGRDAVRVPGIVPLGRGVSGLGGRWT